jgi:hypothetical protein
MHQWECGRCYAFGRYVVVLGEVACSGVGLLRLGQGSASLLRKLVFAKSKHRKIVRAEAAYIFRALSSESKSNIPASDVRSHDHASPHAFAQYLHEPVGAFLPFASLPFTMPPIPDALAPTSSVLSSIKSALVPASTTGTPVVSYYAGNVPGPNGGMVP